MMQNILRRVCSEFVGLIKCFWAEELKENGIKINSLKSCEYVLNYYLEQNSGDKKKALAGYKGLIKDKKVSGIVETILQKEKELKGGAK